MTTTAEMEASREDLRTMIQPGDVVYTVLRHVSRSGMTRHIDVYVIRENRPRFLTGYVADACDYTRADRGYGPLKVSGCGMDMGFDVVYTLGRYLWPDGFPCAGETCQSNDHSNDRHCKREEGAHHHRDGGYALEHRWL